MHDAGSLKILEIIQLSRQSCGFISRTSLNLGAMHRDSMCFVDRIQEIVS
jgi:hypothetical protein